MPDFQTELLSALSAPAKPLAGMSDEELRAGINRFISLGMDDQAVADDDERLRLAAKAAKKLAKATAADDLTAGQDALAQGIERERIEREAVERYRAAKKAAKKAKKG